MDETEAANHIETRNHRDQAICDQCDVDPFDEFDAHHWNQCPDRNVDADADDEADDDIDGDGIVDMIVAADNFVFVYKRIKSFPYFTTDGFYLRFIENETIFQNISNLPVVAGSVFDVVTKDIDKDGDNDILFLTIEKNINGIPKYDQKILINSGNGKFKKEDITNKNILGIFKTANFRFSYTNFRIYQQHLF